ncbi:amino acid transporter [Gymnopilus junonius]|uniref:Amino acid transporter n=1 Tax=Gymnopilus junonius TaxID=109634 RepID=A0A9P5NRI9_GYMJU|nr:amino acid transporter [Gymnopilus junonius]
MFKSSTRARQNAPSELESSQPLLNSRENLNSHTIFSAEDDDDDDLEGSSALLVTPKSSKGGHTVTFSEDVQLIAPPLRSTTSSREAQFEQDSDELDDASVLELDNARTTPRGEHDQRMPLLVGLFESSAARRNSDASLPLRTTNGNRVEIGDDIVDLDELAAKRTAGGGMIDSVANMANSILGAGIIGLPYAIRQAGFFTGLVLLVILCGVTDWTIRLIVVNAKLSGSHSYIDIMTHCFGSSGRAAVSFFQFAFAFGGMCAFGIIIGDTLPQVIRSVFPTLPTIPVLKIFANRQFLIAFCTICFSYPLSLYRDIHKLARASGLALVGMLIIVFSVLIEGPHVPPELKGKREGRFSLIEPGIFQAIGVISFAFVCHHNSLLIYGSLRTPTLDRFAKVTHISTFISLVSCMTLAISAYLVFTDKTQGNILNNFPQNDALINVARFAFGLNMFTTLPLELFVCREVIEQYFFSHEPYNPQRHLFFTTTILYSSMFVALITCDLGVMLEITGGVSATALAFIFPAACYIKLVDKSLAWHSWTKLPAFICVGFGISVMGISLYLALAKSWTPEGSPKICI